MIKKTLIFVSAFIAVVLANTAIPANAAMETLTASFGSSSAPWVIAGVGQTSFPMTLALPKFDPSQGILNDIVLTLSSTDVVGSELFNDTKSTQSYADATADNTTVQITGPEALHTSATMSAGPFSGKAAPHSFVHAGSASEAAITGTAHVPPSDFDHYLGSGMVCLDLSASESARTICGFGPAGVYFGSFADCFGELEIQYFYTAVPEPRTLCAGFVALGFCLFRLKSAYRASMSKKGRGVS